MNANFNIEVIKNSNHKNAKELLELIEDFPNLDLVMINDDFEIVNDDFMNHLDEVDDMYFEYGGEYDGRFYIGENELRDAYFENNECEICNMFGFDPQHENHFYDHRITRDENELYRRMEDEIDDYIISKVEEMYGPILVIKLM